MSFPKRAGNSAKNVALALIDDCHIVAEPYFSSAPPQETEKAATNQENATESTTQEGKPKSRIAAEILANGYILQDQIVAKGLEYDNKYGLSSRLTGYLSSLQANGKILIWFVWWPTWRLNALLFFYSQAVR